MFCKAAKRPLIASLLAVIGTVYPKTRINQPAIGKDSVQRAKSFGSQRQLKALLQPWRTLVDLNKFLNIDSCRMSHARNHVRQKAELLENGIVSNRAYL